MSRWQAIVAVFRSKSEIDTDMAIILRDLEVTAPFKA
jgi:hypothetical protein